MHETKKISPRTEHIKDESNVKSVFKFERIASQTLDDNLKISIPNLFVKIDKITTGKANF